MPCLPSRTSRTISTRDQDAPKGLQQLGKPPINKARMIVLLDAGDQVVLHGGNYNIIFRIPSISF